jgi:hypothetical protein
VEETKNRDYEVGYRKPPKHTRYPKGHSGNPKGRPRGSKNLGTLVREELNAAVEVREHGRTRKISKQKAMIKQLVNRAVSGNPRAIELLLKIPYIQKDLAEAGIRRPLTPEAWEQIKSFVVGDLNSHGGDETPARSRPRQPDISEVASRFEQALKDHRDPQKIARRRRPRSRKRTSRRP